MIHKHFTDLTDEDLVYSKIGNIAINFGYITSKERRLFFQFLSSKGIVAKVDKFKNYLVLYPFMYRTVKSKRTDDDLYITHLFRQDVHIDYNFRETEFLETE